MGKKVTAKVSNETRRKLESIAAARYNGGIGRATIHAIRMGLANPNGANLMVAGEQVTCSVTIEDELIAQITAYQAGQGIAKRTEAVKRLLEIGLS